MKKLLIWSLFGFLCVFGTSCSFSTKNKDPFVARPVVIVTISPYQTWVEQIAGNTLDVQVLIPDNFNPHIYEASPKQLNGLKHASIWFSIGDPIELKLMKTLSWQNKHLKIINISQNLKSTPRATLSIETCHHHHDSVDTHYWLAPQLALKQCEEIKNSLSLLYPKHAHLFEANFQDLKFRFEGAIKELSSLLSPLKGKAFLISHPALSYFADEFDLRQISIECEGKSPKPQDLQKIRNFAKHHPVLCALTLAPFDNKGTIAVAKELNIPVFEFNPHAEDYFENLFSLATHLIESN